MNFRDFDEFAKQVEKLAGEQISLDSLKEKTKQLKQKRESQKSNTSYSYGTWDRDPVQELTDIAECRVRRSNKMDEMRSRSSYDNNLFESSEPVGTDSLKEHTKSGKKKKEKTPNWSGAKTSSSESGKKFRLIGIVVGVILLLNIVSCVAEVMDDIEIPPAPDFIGIETTVEPMVDSYAVIQDSMAMEEENVNNLVDILAGCGIWEVYDATRDKELDYNGFEGWILETEHPETVQVWLEYPTVIKVEYRGELLYDDEAGFWNTAHWVEASQSVEIVEEVANILPSGQGEVTLRIKNIGEETLQTVEVMVSYYWQESYVESQFGSVENLAPGEIWEVRVTSDSNEVDTYEIDDLYAY
jgi:hypothetical protein